MKQNWKGSAGLKTWRCCHLAAKPNDSHLPPNQVNLSINNPTLDNSLIFIQREGDCLVSHPWLKSLSYLTAQSSLAMLNSSWFALFTKAEKKGTWMATAHPGPLGFCAWTVWICLESDKLLTNSQCLENGLLDMVVVTAPNALSEVLDWL